MTITATQTNLTTLHVVFSAVVLVNAFLLNTDNYVITAGGRTVKVLSVHPAAFDQTDTIDLTIEETATGLTYILTIPDIDPA